MAEEQWLSTGVSVPEHLQDGTQLLWPKWWPEGEKAKQRAKKALSKVAPDKWNKRLRRINEIREALLLNEMSERTRLYVFEQQHRAAYHAYGARVEAADKAWEQQQIARELTMSNGDVV